MKNMRLLCAIHHHGYNCYIRVSRDPPAAAGRPAPRRARDRRDVPRPERGVYRVCKIL